jgi:hypothetical protein
LEAGRVAPAAKAARVEPPAKPERVLEPADPKCVDAPRPSSGKGPSGRPLRARCLTHSSSTRSPTTSSPPL